MQTLKRNEENSVLEDESLKHSADLKTASKPGYNWFAKLTDLAALSAACVTVFAQDMFVSRLAAGAYIAVTMLQFASAQRMVAASGKTPEEIHKVSNALRVVGTFVMFVACVVLAVSLVVPLLLRVVGLLAALGSVQTIQKHTRRARNSGKSR